MPLGMYAIELEVKASNSVDAVPPAKTDTNIWPLNVFFFKLWKKGILSSLKGTSAKDIKSVYASLIIIIMLGFLSLETVVLVPLNCSARFSTFWTE